MHGEMNGDHITTLPFTVDSDIRRRTADDAYRFAVYLNLKLSGTNPSRITKIKAETAFAFGNGNAAFLTIREGCLLTKYNATLFPIQFGSHEKVHKESITHMGVDELPVLAMVFHTGTYTAPHGFVGSRVITVMTWTFRREINIATVLRMLRREDMVHHGLLIKVSIACLGITTVEILCQFQHIVGIAGLRTIDIVDKIHAGIFSGEMLTTAVSSESQRSFSSDDIPEKGGRHMIHLITADFCNALKTHHFRYLSIGMQIV